MDSTPISKNTVDSTSSQVSTSNSQAASTPKKVDSSLPPKVKSASEEAQTHRDATLSSSGSTILSGIVSPKLPALPEDAWLNNWVNEICKDPEKNMNSKFEGYSALMHAIFSGRTDLVVTLVRNGFDIDQCDNEGCTPLMTAARLGNQDVVKILLDLGAAVHVVDNEGKTALEYLKKSQVTENKSDLIARYARLVPNTKEYEETRLLNMKKKNEETRLLNMKEYEEVSALVPHMEEYEEVSALVPHMEEYEEVSTKVHGWVRNHPSLTNQEYHEVQPHHVYQWVYNTYKNPPVEDVNEKDITFQGILDVLKLCVKEIGKDKTLEALKQGDNILTISDRNGNTPLMRAASAGETEIVKTLLKMGADKDAKNLNGHTPLMSATRAKSIQIMELVKTESNLNEQDVEGHSALHHAAYAKFARGVELLINMGADPFLSDERGLSALTIAILKNDVEVAKLLLEAAPDLVNFVEKEGMTPILHAEDEDSDMHTFLVNKGADVEDSRCVEMWVRRNPDWHSDPENTFNYPGWQVNAFSQVNAFNSILNQINHED